MSVMKGHMKKRVGLHTRASRVSKQIDALDKSETGAEVDSIKLEEVCETFDGYVDQLEEVRQGNRITFRGRRLRCRSHRS